jgi:hypothetical protein
MLEPLTLKLLCDEALVFAQAESGHWEESLFGTNDGKAVGTYLEQKFTSNLTAKYGAQGGNSASGIDLPHLNVDIKTTSIKQPQSSCPFKSASQKVYGLGYHLLLFVYEKTDDAKRRGANLNIRHAMLIDQDSTADFQTTRQLLSILDNSGNADDVVAFLMDRNLPLDEIGASALAEEILKRRPAEGILTISNALQWRLQYARAIQQAVHHTSITRIV